MSRCRRTLSVDTAQWRTYLEGPDGQLDVDLDRVVDDPGHCRDHIHQNKRKEDNSEEEENEQTTNQILDPPHPRCSPWRGVRLSEKT